MTANTTSNELTVAQLIEQHGREMDLSVLTGSGGLQRLITTPELNRPGLAFAGFHEVFTHDRIQIVGNTEMMYLRSLSPEERQQRIDSTLQYHMPCIIVTELNDVPEDLIAAADKNGVPILLTSLPTTRLVGHLNSILERFFAPMLNIHGDLLDVFGMGTLLVGNSGVGKSECALELIERGHRLVADDQVLVRRLSKDNLIGRSSDVLKYHMEIRGLGILNIEKLFGIASVAEEKEIELVVRLEKWDESMEYERLGIDNQTQLMFDVPVPRYVLPVQPGRNISIMVEMAALTQRLKNSGINPAEAMEQMIMNRLRRPGGQ